MGLSEAGWLPPRLHVPEPCPGPRFASAEKLATAIFDLMCRWKLYATRSARDLSYLFLSLYCAGCLLTFVYL